MQNYTEYITYSYYFVQLYYIEIFKTFEIEYFTIHDISYVKYISPQIPFLNSS